jgi:hypothetical protein
VSHVVKGRKEAVVLGDLTATRRARSREATPPPRFLEHRNTDPQEVALFPPP